jgi:hypothetical protein
MKVLRYRARDAKGLALRKQKCAGMLPQHFASGSGSEADPAAARMAPKKRNQI